MAETLTLKALKEQNAAEEAGEEVETEVIEDVVPDEEIKEEITEEKTETNEEPGGEEEAHEQEAWQKSDDDAHEKKYTRGDIGRAKFKLRGKLDKKHTAETESLQTRIKELESTQQLAPKGLTTPRRDDFLDEKDPDEAFLIALSKYNTDKATAEFTASNQAQQVSTQRAVATQKINTDVDANYDRAEKLIEKSGIGREKYQAADLRVRNMMERLYPEAGDALVDAFISKMGAGSEKVMFNLGVNTAKLDEFEGLLKGDSTGIDAAIWLGKLNEQLTTPAKRKSNAPAPAKPMKGDKVINQSMKSMKAAYKKAADSGDMQQVFNIRRKAKAEGVSQKEVNTW